MVGNGGEWWGMVVILLDLYMWGWGERAWRWVLFGKIFGEGLGGCERMGLFLACTEVRNKIFNLIKPRAYLNKVKGSEIESLVLERGSVRQ